MNEEACKRQLHFVTHVVWALCLRNKNHISRKNLSWSSQLSGHDWHPIHTYIYMCVCVCVCVCVYIYVCMYVHLFKWMYGLLDISQSDYSKDQTTIVYRILTNVIFSLIFMETHTYLHSLNRMSSNMVFHCHNTLSALAYSRVVSKVTWSFLKKTQFGTKTVHEFGPNFGSNWGTT